jgi:hypothetical protein
MSSKEVFLVSQIIHLYIFINKALLFWQGNDRPIFQVKRKGICYESRTISRILSKSKGINSIKDEAEKGAAKHHISYSGTQMNDPRINPSAYPANASSNFPCPPFGFYGVAHRYVSQVK